MESRLVASSLEPRSHRWSCFRQRYSVFSLILYCKSLLPCANGLYRVDIVTNDKIVVFLDVNDENMFTW